MSCLTLNIKYLRKKAGWDKFQVATLMNISVEEYNKIENEERLPTMAEIVQLSHICHTTCDELLGF